MLYQTENPHGGDIYRGKIVLDYSANINPLGTPPGVVAAMAEALNRVQHYPDPYCRELVRAISAFETVPAQYILCGNGAAELIYAYCKAVKPNLAVMPSPTFSEYASALELVGCKVRRYCLKKENYFDLDEKFIEFAEREMPGVIFLCSPNNPSGRLISRELLEKILCFCKCKGIRLFLDECFLEFTEGGESMKNFLHAYPQLFILKAFTKSYGMAGVRLGYCLSSDSELLAAMAKVSQPWNVSLIAQAAGTAALRETQFLQAAKEIISCERLWLKQKLEAFGFWVCPSDANYILFQAIPGLCAKLEKHGIAIRNCDNYYGLAGGWYRIAVRQHDENEQLIAAVSSIIKGG